MSASFLTLQTRRYLDIQIKSYGQNCRTMQNKHSGSYVSTHDSYESNNMHMLAHVPHF